MKTSEAPPRQIDWLVAKCEGYDCQFDDEVSGPWLVPQDGYLHDEKPLSVFSPTTNWAQAGPIIEREKIGLFFDHACGNKWRASHITAPYQLGPTPLIAAMRCYVAGAVGEEVEVPPELI